MIIEWKKNRLKIIPLLGLKASKGASQLVLMPGFNDVNDALWKEIKTKFKLIRFSLDEGDIVEKVVTTKLETTNKNGKKEVKEKEVTSFKDMSSEDCIKIIDDTWDIKVMKNWKKEDDRADIRNYIDEHIAKIKDNKADKNIGKRDDERR